MISDTHPTQRRADPARVLRPRASARGIAALVVGILVLAAATPAVVRAVQSREKRVVEIEPGRILRGAWQHPRALVSLVERRGVRTILTLTAINPDDPKYVAQAEALRELASRGRAVEWRLIPMRGSTATLEEMAEAADILADTDRHPVFLHCVGGHHRSSLVHAAHLVRNRGRTANQAWDEIRALPWTRPEQSRDQRDRELIHEFERWNRRHPREAAATEHELEHNHPRSPAR